MTPDGTYRSARAGETITIAEQFVALPAGFVGREPDGSIVTRLLDGAGAVWRRTGDGRNLFPERVALPLTVLFRPDAPQPATTADTEVTPEQAAKYLLSDEDTDAWDTAPLAVRGDLSARPHPLRWSAEHGSPYTADLPLDRVLAHWFEHVANTVEPDEADPAVVSADYTRLRAALAAAGAGAESRTTLLRLADEMQRAEWPGTGADARAVVEAIADTLRDEAARSGAGAEVDREALASTIWHASRADEGTISAIGAEHVADAVIAFLAARGDAATPTEVGHVEDVQSVGMTGEGDGAEPGATRITVIIEGPRARFAIDDLVTVSAWREVS